MIEKSLDIIYNKKYLVIVPSMTSDLLESFRYSFKNVVLMKNNLDDLEFMIDFINKNNFKKLIFVDYQVEYEQLIARLKIEPKIDFIFTRSLGALTDKFIYDVFMKVYELYKQYNSSLGLLDKGLFNSLKNQKESVKYLILDIEEKYEEVQYEDTIIGLLNNEEDPKHSFYNELSAIKLIDNMKAKICKPTKVTKEFLKAFEINYDIASSKDSLLEGNIVNLYVNFAANNNFIFLKSMDKSIPCILGNVEFLDNYKYLKEMLVVNSDDNIDEIAAKIKLVIKNRDKICREYKKFRKDYSEKSKETIKKFLNFKIENNIDDKSELLMTVVVPVYNVEKYLANSLDSIIEASIDNMEILVINDGSTDNSEEIILKYQKKYPELIRYIKQENHGLGNVRNVGLREAKGKYIASIDSDDTINPAFFEDALKYMQEDIDIIICDWLTVTDETRYETAALDHIFADINRYEGLLYTTIMPSTCNKIIKKSLYKELDLTYIEDKFEDLSTNPFVMLRAETIKYINKPYYEYYIRSNSINRTKPGFSMIDIIKVVNERLKKYNDYVNVDIEKFKYYTFAWRIEEYVINQLYTIDESEIDEYVKYINDKLKSIILDIFNNKLYKARIDSLKTSDLKEYIIKRNKALEDGELTKFIKDVRKNDKYCKLTPPIMYYGD